jgi:DNA repair protein RadC
MEQKTFCPELAQVAEIELVYKTKVKASSRPIIKSSKEAYELIHLLWNENTIELREEFKVLFLNRRNSVIGIYHASSGGITGTVVDTRLIIIAALKINCVAIMLFHNHPSGSLKPSRQDEAFTKQIKEGAGLLDINVLDHIIVTKEYYFSFADEGLL